MFDGVGKYGDVPQFLFEMKGALGNEHEDEANEFARDWLIPHHAAKVLAGMPKTELAVRALADKLEIAPGIIVGRLQKESLLRWDSVMNKSLKVSYEWQHGT